MAEVTGRATPEVDHDALGEPVIGFCILSHSDQAQLLALVRTLNTVYGFPPIVCHHDSSQSPIDAALFPDNVRLTSRSFTTGWGRSSVVHAGILAIQELFEHFAPDWFVLLSASDYPIATAGKVRSFLSKSTCDAFVDARDLFIQAPTPAKIVGNNSPTLRHFDSAANFKIKHRLYLATEIWIPIVRRKPRLRLGRYTIRLPFVGAAAKRGKINVYYGDHWLMGNARAARTIYEDSQNKTFLLNHLKHRANADECYYQSILLNDSALTVCRDAKRFTEWNGGGAHPMLLTDAQFDDISRSGSFFARKFEKNSSVIDRIDRELLGIGSGG